MQLMGRLIFAGAITSISSILNYASVDAQTSSTAATGQDISSRASTTATDIKDNNFNLSTASKAIVDEGSRLKNDATGWYQKIQELELDFNKSQQDDEATVKNVNESLVVLRTAANRLGPDAEARVALRKQEGALRELASRAEVHSLPEIRKTVVYFQQKTTELHALSRSVEETRMELMTQIDLLQELKVQLEFNRAGGQIGELLKRVEVNINSIQVIATNAQQLANDLAGFGRTTAAAGQPADRTNSAPQTTTTPATAAKTAINPAQAIKTPATEARPADGARPAQTIKRR
jgi:hypothetical protein